MTVVNIMLQALIAFVVFLALKAIATYVMTSESILVDATKKVSVPIISGWVDTKGFTDKQFTTSNMFAKNYVNLPNSVNRRGGAQFSYTMWVKFNDLSDANVANKVLFVRGDKTIYPYTMRDSNNDTSNVKDYVVKCPLVRFGDSAKSLIVQFNTSNDISTQIDISRVPNADETVRHNIFSLIPGKWIMLSFVFEDHMAYQETEDGVLFKMYVNDMLYHTQHVPGMMRVNQGDFNILPNKSTIEGGNLADINYYNYALNAREVAAISSRGFKNIRYNDMASDPDFNQPLYLSQYNKLEINNL
jgi:hypothetical protein